MANFNQNLTSLLGALGLGKTAGNVNLAVQSPFLGRAANEANKTIKDSSAMQQQLIAAAKKEKDKQKKSELLQKSRMLSQNIGDLGEEVGGFADTVQQLGNVSKQNLKMSNPAFAAKRGLQQSAELASYAVPFGKGIKGAGAAMNLLSKTLAPGAAVAALGKLSQDDANLGNVATAAAGGAAGAGLLGAAGNALAKGSKGLSNRLMNTVFKEPLKATRSAIKTGGQTLGEEAVEKGFKGLTPESIYKNSVREIEVLEDNLQKKLSSSAESIPIKDIRSGVNKLVQKYKDAGNESAGTRILSRIEALQKQHGENIPVKVANKIKRTLYEEARNAYGQVSSEEMEGVKGIARALREGISKKVDGADTINKGLSYQGKIADSIADRLARGGRNNLLGLTQGVLTGGGIAGAVPSGGLSLAPAALTAVLGSTPGKIISSKLLNTVGKGADKTLMNPIMQQILGQASSRAGGAASAAVSQESAPVDSLSKPGVIDPNNNQQDSRQDIQVTPQSEDMLSQLTSQGIDPQIAQQFIQALGPQASGQPQALQQPAQNVLNPYGVSPEELYQESYIALAAGDKQTAAMLQKMYTDEIAYQDRQLKMNPNQKEKNSASLAVEGKSKTGLQAISSMETLLKDNPSLLNRTGIPMLSLLKGQDRKQYDSAVSSFADALGGLRTGASVSPEQQQFYKNMLPKPGDDAKTIAKKFQDLRDELSIYAQTKINDNLAVTELTEEDQIMQLLASQGLNLQ